MGLGLLSIFKPFRDWESAYAEIGFDPEKEYIGADKRVYCKACHKCVMWFSPSDTHFARVICECEVKQ